MVLLTIITQIFMIWMNIGFKTLMNETKEFIQLDLEGYFNPSHIIDG